ncbi:hypothetical protein BACCAP_00884 [Pseudoflavonifractor capillosus ATCC 29799]|uniref:Uncharacterized protein n=1 Tax=Pseudoflavonifractor capillosus ATCC 29799 TaxID=411467 RepID=A6NRQ6_9FIRM|nr:hypothetical protein BACCAP_00884 [Pseudoflavonifractor capillosus ATCC 29799]
MELFSFPFVLLEVFFFPRLTNILWGVLFRCQECLYARRFQFCFWSLLLYFFNFLLISMKRTCNI